MTGTKGEALAFARLLSFGKALEGVSDIASLLETSLEYSHLIFETQQTSIFLQRDGDGALLLEACSGWSPVNLSDRFYSNQLSHNHPVAIARSIHNGTVWLRAWLSVGSAPANRAMIVLDLSGSRVMDDASLRIFTERFARAYAELRWLKSALIPIVAISAEARAAADLAQALACEMGLSQRNIDELRVAARLKDSGYEKYLERFWEKPGPLSEAEWQENRRHPILSEELLERQPAPVNVRMAVRQHHEYFNGKGYPDGLATEAISLHARILAVADVYTALVSSRPHRAALTGSQAMEVISQNSGTQFDPRIVRVLALAVIRSKCPPG